MRRVLHLFVPVLLLVTACQRELTMDQLKPQLQTDSTGLLLPDEIGFTDSFTILSNIEWTISIEPAHTNWFITSAAAGNGTTKIYVTVLKETTGAGVQKATLVIAPQKDATISPVNVTVSQNKPGSFAFVRNVYGGSGADEFFSVVAAPGGGYVAVGITESVNGDVSGVHGREDVWVVKIDAKGNKVWQRTLGGVGRDFGFEIITTADGGYIIAGEGEDNSGDITGNHGYADAWIIKLDDGGQIKWQRSIGGTDFDLVSGIVRAAGGGYVAAGFTNSSDGDIINNKELSELLVMKLSESGSTVWIKTFGGASTESASSVVAASDGGYIIAGHTQSNDGDVSGNHGFDDAWILKLDENGNKVWQKLAGGSGADLVTYITQSKDGGYVFTGYTNSNDGDVSGNHGNLDIWVVKLDVSGNIAWQKTLGGSDQDIGRYVTSTADGGYLVTGYTNSNDGDVTINHGIKDAWVIKLDAGGNKIWQKTLGGSDEDYGYKTIELLNGNYVLAGSSFSNNGDIIGPHGHIDAWLFKFRQ